MIGVLLGQPSPTATMGALAVTWEADGKLIQTWVLQIKRMEGARADDWNV